MKQQKGFTLIELMIVIAIIAILAAMIVPAMTDSNSTAVQEVQHTQCIEGVKFTNPTNSSDAPTQIIGPDGNGISCDTVTDSSWDY